MGNAIVSKNSEKKVCNLKALFEPKSVAVIGASRRKEAVGHAILSNLLSAGFKGPIYPINPKVDRILDIKCHPSIDKVAGPIDLAVIIVPSPAVPKSLEECAQKGVRAAIIISAGFREVGPEGRKLETQCAEIAKKANISLLGPNCLGMINPDPNVSLNASFSRTMPTDGNMAFISQSGALCAAILDYAKGENIGFSKFVSMGNKIDIDELDLLRYLKDDPQTDVILMYLEELTDGRAFIEMAREITGDIERTKPILAIKSGRTLQGARAAQSHTGSMMGSDEVYDAIFEQGGVLRVDSVSEIFDYARAFANEPLPKAKRVAIVTNAGGPGIMTTDACVRYGIEMAQFEPSTIEALKEKLPPTANFSNPVDVIGDAQHDRYEHALQCVLKDPNVDSVIVVLTPQAMTDIEEIAKVVVDLDRKTFKTVLACFMGIVDTSGGVKILEENHVPHYTFPEEAARTLAQMIRYKEWIDRPRTEVKIFPVDSAKAVQVIEAAKGNGQTLLTAYQSMQVLEAYGFPVLPYGFANSEANTAEVAERIGFPVAMKIVSREVVHKLDVGGVVLNLKSADEVKNSYLEILQNVRAQNPQASLDGVFIQAMGKTGREVILGMNRDPHFGPVLMFGLGGIYVEVLKDVTFRLAPIRALTAQFMMENIRAYPILKGVRGQPPADFKAITECLQRLSQLSCEQAMINEIDINPLIVYDQGQGAHVIDARIVIA